MDTVYRSHGHVVPGLEVTGKRDFRVAPYRSWLQIRKDCDPLSPNTYMELDNSNGIWWGVLTVGQVWTYQVRVSADLFAISNRVVNDNLKACFKEHVGAVIKRVSGDAVVAIYTNSNIWLQDKGVRQHATELNWTHAEACKAQSKKLFLDLSKILEGNVSVSEEKVPLSPLQGTGSIMHIINPGDVVVANCCHHVEDFGHVHLGERFVVLKGGVIDEKNINVVVQKETDSTWTGVMSSSNLNRAKK